MTTTLPAGPTANRFRYWTDESIGGLGFAPDSIRLGAQPVDGITEAYGWTLDGFRRVTDGAYTITSFHYLAESRSYLSSDRSLCGAYQEVSCLLVHRQCYARGLLSWYRNSAFADNDVWQHPGGGRILPVDVRPQAMLMPDGKTAWGNRWPRPQHLPRSAYSLTAVTQHHPFSRSCPR